MNMRTRPARPEGELPGVAKFTSLEETAFIKPNKTQAEMAEDLGIKTVQQANERMEEAEWQAKIERARANAENESEIVLDETDIEEIQEEKTKNLPN